MPIANCDFTSEIIQKGLEKEDCEGKRNLKKYRKLTAMKGPLCIYLTMKSTKDKNVFSSENQAMQTLLP